MARKMLENLRENDFQGVKKILFLLKIDFNFFQIAPMILMGKTSRFN